MTAVGPAFPDDVLERSVTLLLLPILATWFLGRPDLLELALVVAGLVARLDTNLVRGPGRPKGSPRELMVLNLNRRTRIRGRARRDP